MVVGIVIERGLVRALGKANNIFVEYLLIMKGGQLVSEARLGLCSPRWGETHGRDSLVWTG